MKKILAIDIGSSTLKMIEVTIGQRPSVSYSSVVPIGSEHNEADISNAIKKAIADNSLGSKSAVLTFSEESVAFRRVELPGMPQREIPGALKWKAKDLVPFDIHDAVLGFALLGEVQKEGGPKAIEVIFAAVSKEIVEKNIRTIKGAGLDVLSVNFKPFGMENILSLDSSTDESKAIIVVDFGYATTEISIYKRNKLQFTRAIPIGSRAIRSAVMSLSAGEGQPGMTDEVAEKIERDIGISYEEVPLANGASSMQMLSLIRPVLENLSKEIRRSVDYYAQQYGEDGTVEGYILGGGSGLKNLDKYLSEELAFPIKKMVMPASVETSVADLSKDWTSMAGLVGVALSCKGCVNLLPAEYKTEKIEAIEKISFRMAVFAMALILAVSFLFTKLRVYDYSHRLMNVKLQQGALEQVRELQEKVVEREAFLRQAEGTEVPTAYIMKELSNIVPDNVVLNSLQVNQSGKVITMRGYVHLPGSNVQRVLTKFTEDLERCMYLKDAQISSVQGSKVDNEEVSSFEIVSSLE